MTLDKIGLPFQGKVWYWVEDSYGGGESTTTLPISKYVQNVRVDTGDRHKVIRGIDSPVAAELLKQPHEPKFHLEYIPQVGDTLLADLVNRNSNGELQSLAFCFGVNTKESDTDDQSWYYVVGAKPASIRIAASKGNEYTISVDFECKQVTPSTSQTGTEPSALSGDILAFNIAGEITKSAGHVVDTDHIAFVTNSIDITITHKLTGYIDHDEMYKTALVEGEMDVEGSVDITLDGGGESHITEVLANTSFNLIIDMGDTGAPRLTLTNCEWKNSSVTGDTGGEAVSGSIPFTAKPSSYTSIVSAVP